MENSTKTYSDGSTENVDLLTEELVPGFPRFELYEIEEDGFVDFVKTVISVVEQSYDNPEYVLCNDAGWASYDLCYNESHAKKFCVSPGGSFMVHYMENESYLRKNQTLDLMDFPAWSWDFFSAIEELAFGNLELAFAGWEATFSTQQGDIGGYQYPELLDEKLEGEDCEVFPYWKDFAQWKKDMLAVDRVLRYIEEEVYELAQNLLWAS